MLLTALCLFAAASNETKTVIQAAAQSLLCLPNRPVGTMSETPPLSDLKRFANPTLATAKVKEGDEILQWMRDHIDYCPLECDKNALRESCEDLNTRLLPWRLLKQAQDRFDNYDGDREASWSANAARDDLAQLRTVLGEECYLVGALPSLPTWDPEP